MKAQKETDLAKKQKQFTGGRIVLSVNRDNQTSKTLTYHKNEHKQVMGLPVKCETVSPTNT